jgi:hypothetical protein
VTAHHQDQAILPLVDGFLSSTRRSSRHSFAADVDPDTADFMDGSKIPCGVEAFGGEISKPATRQRSSTTCRPT